MAEPSTAFPSISVYRVLVLVLLTLGLLQLLQLSRNGHYAPVPGNLRLTMDTRTGEYHLARVAKTLADEVRVHADSTPVRDDKTP